MTKSVGFSRLIFRSALAAIVLFSLTVSSSARKAKTPETATLVETANYVPCGDGCSPFVYPASAFCFRMGDQFMVGEGRSYLHENRFSGLEDLSGKQMPIRFNRHSIWLEPSDRAALRLTRGSQFENFKDPGCIREVHRPILAAANSSRRPATVPPAAVALAGSGKGNLPPPFLWFQCAMDSNAATMTCRRWYRKGEPDGKDWYCARTVDGVPVGANFEVDPLLSQEDRLILKSGAVLQHDNRARTNGELDRPGEACR